MNINNIAGSLFAVLMFETPLLVSLWFCIKGLHLKIDRIKSAKVSNRGRKKEINKILILIVIIFIITILAILVIIMAIVPKSLTFIPLPMRLFLLFGLLVVYGCFASIFLGLGDVVGAGGSASKAIKSLSDYLSEALEIKQTNQHDSTKK